MTEFPRLYIKSDNPVTGGPDGLEPCTIITETEISQIFEFLWQEMTDDKQSLRAEYDVMLEQEPFKRLGEFID